MANLNTKLALKHALKVTSTDYNLFYFQTCCHFNNGSHKDRSTIKHIHILSTSWQLPWSYNLFLGAELQVIPSLLLPACMNRKRHGVQCQSIKEIELNYLRGREPERNVSSVHPLNPGPQRHLNFPFQLLHATVTHPLIIPPQNAN